MANRFETLTQESKEMEAVAGDASALSKPNDPHRSRQARINAFFDTAELIIKRMAGLLGTFLSECEHLAFKLAIVILAILKLIDLINKK